MTEPENAVNAAPAKEKVPALSTTNAAMQIASDEPEPEAVTPSVFPTPPIDDTESTAIKTEENIEDKKSSTDETLTPPRKKARSSKVSPGKHVVFDVDNNCEEVLDYPSDGGEPTIDLTHDEQPQDKEELNSEDALSDDEKDEAN